MKFIFIGVFSVLFHFVAYSQESNSCQLEFEYSISNTEDANLFDINLNLKNGKGRYEVKLFDMVKNSMVKTYSFDRKNGTSQTIIKGINKGVYLIGISQGNCHQTIGGINGFKVE